MSIHPGSRLGPYEIVASIGAGGMGEVYRARDPRLDREVAIKVLPDAFVTDTDRVARFEREARTLAALNHPNIGGIYGLEQSDGTTALILEFIEGSTLAERIVDGAIPVEEALGIARQIAEALEAAHDHGIIHRDLKPANIKLRPDGTVKVLDFGLAKALDTAPAGSSSLSFSPTLTSPATQIGVILGTAAYMAPEQARGRPVDKRADVWAYGCVLFEMLTGRRAFEGTDVTDIIAAIVRGEPEWSALPAETPPAIRRLLQRCLAKDPRRRLREVGSAIVEIDEAATSSGSAPQAIAPSRPRWQRRALIAGAAVALAALTGTTTWLLTRPQRSTPQIVRFKIPLGPDRAFSATGRPIVAISPQGTHVAYVANFRIYLRAVNEFEARPVRGTEGAAGSHGRSPFFSPDGTWLGFWDGGALKRAAITGGSPVTLTTAENPWGVSWGDDDTILYGQSDGIWQVAGTGGTARKIIEAKDGESLHGPQRLPGGEWILFAVRPPKTSDWDDAQIVVHSLVTGERKSITQGGRDPRYLRTGHVAYVQDGVLYAVAFDLATLETRGGVVSLAEQIGDSSNTTGAAHYDISANGSLVYASISGGGGVPLTFVWVDRDGRETAVPGRPRAYQEFNLSPDGNRIAVRVLEDGQQDVWIHDLVRQTETRLTFDEAGEVFPTWTPDGRRVAFGGIGIPLSWRAADGTGVVEVLAESPRQDPTRRPQSFSPDGSILVYEGAVGAIKLGMLSLTTKRATPLFQDAKFGQRNAMLSPDGRWLAYESDESGTPEIYVRPFPDVNAGRWQISSGGGRWPVWHPSPNGHELFYLGPKAVMALAFGTNPTFTPGAVATLFETAPFNSASAPASNRRMDVSRDGKRFLFLKAGSAAIGEENEQSLSFVENWFEELKARVPTQ